MAQQRYVILVFVIGAILTGMVVRSAVVSLFAQWAMPDNMLIGLLPTSAALGIVVGLVSFFAVLRHRPSVKFTDEVISELAKVTWPTREETVKATTTVVFTTLFVAALLGLYDLVWKNVADLVLFTEG